MGLDMYLSARRYLRTWGNDNDIELMNELNARFGLELIDSDKPFSSQISVKELVFDAAYWRKANQIHAWFVKNVQDGEDECKEHYVERAKLRELIDTCRTVMENKHRAAELLPSQSGFFFGGTEYDEWYFKDVAYTIDRLEKVLATPAFDHCDFYYQSSW
jgi:hypothetical protein